MTAANTKQDGPKEEQVRDHASCCIIDLVLGSQRSGAGLAEMTAPKKEAN